MALGASRLGVAARVVTGAAPGRGGLVDYGDLTSWVELQFEDGTWRPLDLERYLGSRVLEEGTEPVPAPDPAEFVQDSSTRHRRAGTGRSAPPSVPSESRPAWQVALGVVAATGGARPRRAAARAGGQAAAPGTPPPYVVVVRACTSTAGRRCSTRPATAAPRCPEGWSRAGPGDAAWVCRPDLARWADAAVFAPAAPRPRTAATSGTRASSCDGELLAEAGRRRRWWSCLNPAVAHGRLGPRPSVSPAGAPRRSPCPASAGRGCVTSRPRPGRGPRATRARRGRPGRSRRRRAARTQSPSVRWCST